MRRCRAVTAMAWIVSLSGPMLCPFLIAGALAQQVPQNPPPPVGAAARAQANLNGTISTMDGFGAYGDGLAFTFYVCFTNNTSFCSAQAANIVSFPSPQNGTLSTTLSGSAGGGTLTAGTGFCKSEMAGSPIYIPGAAPGGGGLLSRIVACIGAQGGSGATKVSISPPVAQVPSGTITIAYGAMALNSGAGWQSTDMGKGIVIGASGGGTTGANFIITAVNSPTNITLSGNVGNIINGGIETVVWGHDDSTAVSSACAAVLASGLRDLQIPVKHFTPSLSFACYGVRLHGNGAILASDFTMPAGSAVGNVTELVVPDNAPPPSAPVKSVVAARDLVQTRLCGPAPTFVNTGDSLETLMPNALSGLGTYPGAFQSAFLKQNQGIWPTFRNGGIGGAQFSNFDGNPNGTNGDVITSTSTSWLSQVAAVTPCGMTIGFGNNDGVGLSLPALVDSFLKLTGNGSTFTTPPDIIYFTHHPYSRINSSNGGLFSDGDDYASGYICSFAAVMHRPCIDGAREGEKHLFGYDPGAMQFTRRYDLPYNTNSTGLPLTPSFYVNGFAAQFLKSGQNGTTFWNNFTGNSGVSDPRGPFIAFFLGRNSDNVLWLFYNTGTNQIGYECDPSSGLPGLGCDGPTGLPPVTPSLQSNMTVANTGPSGVAQVTASAGVFGPCAVGGTVAVPGAGPTETPPGFASYAAPLVTTVQTCNSTTLMTLNAAASNTYSAQPGFVMFGNPVVWSSVTDTSNCTNEPFSVEVNFDQARVWFCSQYQPVYAGPIMRSRNQFQPKIFSGGSRPSITIAGDAVAGGTTYMTTRPVPNQVTYTDDEVSGPATNAPLSNQSYSGPQGGDGNNHNPQGYGARVIQALMDAQDLNLGLSQGLYTNVPTTGFALAIPNGYATALLKPAGTLATGAVTLPQTYPQNQDFILTSTQTITTLTLSANTGQTINGAPSTLAGNTSVRFRLEGAAWVRLQ
jgi:hypothetical protein